MLYQQNQHIESMLKLRRHIIINEFPRHIDVLFWCNFDGRIIDVILMLFFDIISMDRKLTQLQHASLNAFLEDKKSWSFQCLLLVSFRNFKSESRLAVSFRCCTLGFFIGIFIKFKWTNQKVITWNNRAFMIEWSAILFMKARITFAW